MDTYTPAVSALVVALCIFGGLYALDSTPNPWFRIVGTHQERTIGRAWLLGATFVAGALLCVIVGIGPR